MNDLFLRNLHLDIYGGSHDPEIGVRADGFPAGEAVDTAVLQAFLAHRAPGSTKYGTRRRETDEPHFLSGLQGGILTGERMEAVIYNKDQRSADYPKAPDVPRPSHADYPAIVKYGEGVDLRGGGKFSARLTAPLCIAGGIALQILARRGIRIGAHIASVGDVEDARFDPLTLSTENLDILAARPFPTVDPGAAERMGARIEEARMSCDSVGAVIECGVVGLPVGLGEHMFWGLENRIAHVMFAIPALKGIEFGAGFDISRMRGSDANDPFQTDGKRIYTTQNNCGGILGGMSSGMPLIFRGAMKPTPTIAREQDSISLSRMENVKIKMGGRHDPCVAVRAVPVFEAAAALAILDAVLDEK